MVLFQLPVNLVFEKIKQVEFARVVSNLLVFSIRIKQALFMKLPHIFQVECTEPSLSWLKAWVKGVFWAYEWMAI